MNLDKSALWPCVLALRHIASLQEFSGNDSDTAARNLKQLQVAKRQAQLALTEALKRAGDLISELLNEHPWNQYTKKHGDDA